MGRRLRWNTRYTLLVLVMLGSLAITTSPVRADQIELEPDSVIGGTGSWAGANVWNEGQFSAEWVADNQLEEEIDEFEQDPNDDSGGFWLGKESDEEEAFVLDLEQAYSIDGILLYNTHNATFDDRATNGYEIHGSNEVAPYDEGDVGEGGDDLVDPVLMSEGELELAYSDEDPLQPQPAEIMNSGPFRYIRFSTIGPFHEDDVILAQRSVGINEIKIFGSLGGGDPCDYNDDGVRDDADLDLLQAEINAGTNAAKFDVNGDGSVNSADLDVYVESPDKLNTWFGDSNLDGEFNTTDFVFIFTAGKFEDGIPMNAGWAEGDWNADLEFDSSDFVAAFQGGGFEMGRRPDGGNAAIPEPSGVLLVAWGLLALALRRRK